MAGRIIVDGAIEGTEAVTPPGERGRVTGGQTLGGAGQAGGQKIAIRVPKHQGEIVPGGWLWEQTFRDITQTLQALQDQINNIDIDIELPPQSIDSVVDTIAYVPGSSNDGAVTQGNICTVKTSDNQYVSVFRQVSGNTLTFAAIKSLAAPYTIWTSLDETSADQTVVFSTTDGAVAGRFVPSLCEDPVTGDLFLLALNLTTDQICSVRLKKNGTAYSVGASDALHTVSSTNYDNCLDIIPSGDGNLLAITHQPGNGLSVYRGAIDATHVTWTEMCRYVGIHDGGANHGLPGTAPGISFRLIPMDAGNILALWFHGAGPLQYNIAWALSTDYGQSWPGGIGAYLNTPSRTGTLLPTTLGNASTSNLELGILNNILQPSFEAAWIPGTTRVGLVYAGNNTAGQQAGVYYCEFDRTGGGGMGGWTAQAAHVRLSKSTRCAHPMLTLNDGCARVMWVHQDQAAVTGNPGGAFLYYRACPNAALDALNARKWQAARSLLPMRATSPNWTTSECNVIRDGLDSVGGVVGWPMQMQRYYVSGSTSNARQEICLKIFPVEALDRA